MKSGTIEELEVHQILRLPQKNGEVHQILRLPPK